MSIDNLALCTQCRSYTQLGRGYVKIWQNYKSVPHKMLIKFLEKHPSHPIRIMTDIEFQDISDILDYKYEHI